MARKLQSMSYYTKKYNAAHAAMCRAWDAFAALGDADLPDGEFTSPMSAGLYHKFTQAAQKSLYYAERIGGCIERIRFEERHG